MIKIYTTNVLDKSDEEMMEILLERWEIETLHRDANSTWGLKIISSASSWDTESRARCSCGIYSFCPVLASKILEPLGRLIKTIGEGCRF